jgi:hypothetical protein
MLKSNSCIPTNKINYLFYIQHVWIYSLLSRLLSEKTCTGLDCELHVMCLTRNMKCLPYASFFNLFLKKILSSYCFFVGVCGLLILHCPFGFLWRLSMTYYCLSSLINVRENLGGNLEWRIQRHGQYWWKTRAILVKDTERSRTTNKTVKH